MSESENILVCLLVPIVYVLTYIAGKYDVLSVICMILAEKAEKYLKEKEDDLK